MTYQLGGWTLVGNTPSVPLKDSATDYYTDLARELSLSQGGGV